MTAPFGLDPRLEADGAFLLDLPVCHVRIARDARWPWLVAVPRVAGAEELFDLAAADRAALIEEVARLATALKAETGALKINVATLGNIVRQLHIHIVARTEGDPAWPGPIWGHGTAQAYAPAVLAAFTTRLRHRLA